MSRWTDPRVLDLARRGWGEGKPIRAAVKQIKRAEAALRGAAPEGRCPDAAVLREPVHRPHPGKDG